MPEEIIKIGCPVCGSVLSIRNQPGLETMAVTCPVCKTKNPFVRYKRRATRPQQAERTQYGESPAKAPAANYAIGQLIDAQKRIYRLSPGRNVVGRKATQTTATVQIDTPSKRVSRDHLVIEVRKVPGTGYVHVASLYKDKVNETRVGNAALEYGDEIILNDGDLVVLPDCPLKFVIPDEESTQI